MIPALVSLFRKPWRVKNKNLIDKRVIVKERGSPTGGQKNNAGVWNILFDDFWDRCTKHHVSQMIHTDQKNALKIPAYFFPARSKGPSTDAAQCVKYADDNGIGFFLE